MSTIKVLSAIGLLPVLLCSSCTCCCSAPSTLDFEGYASFSDFKRSLSEEQDLLLLDEICYEVLSVPYEKDVYKVYASDGCGWFYKSDLNSIASWNLEYVQTEYETVEESAREFQFCVWAINSSALWNSEGYYVSSRSERWMDVKIAGETVLSIGVSNLETCGIEDFAYVADYLNAARQEDRL